MQKGHELLIPTAHALLEFLALIKSILFTKKGNSTIVFLVFIFSLLYYGMTKDGWFIAKMSIAKEKKEQEQEQGEDR